MKKYIPYILIVVGSISFILSVFVIDSAPAGPIAMFGGIGLVVAGILIDNESRKKKKFEAHMADVRKREASRQKKCAQFEAELESIPLVEITPIQGAKVNRQYLKDLPELPYRPITRKTKIANMFPLVFIDVETTGLHTSSSRITEVTALYFKNSLDEPAEAFTTLINPCTEIPEETVRINGITEEMVEDAPTFASIRDQLQGFIAGANIAGHNLDFDMKFLFTSGLDVPLDVKYYDMLPFAQKVLKRGSDVQNHKLETLCSHYGIYRETAHRSLSDCLAESKVFNCLLQDYRE